MLQSCALGMSVVNIDNGIGAGAAAANIANRSSRHRYYAKSDPVKKSKQERTKTRKTSMNTIKT